MEENKLSLIVPIYNAKKFILDTLKSITEWKKNINYNVQVIIVDDGSKDNTSSLVKSYINNVDSSIELISYETNKGKGYAVKKGMLDANGKFRVYTDVDIPFGFEILDKVIYYLEIKEFDVVIGDRTLVGSNYFTKINNSRKFGSKIFSFLVGSFIAGGHFDTQCGLKGFTEKSSNDIFSVLMLKGFAFDVELLYISLKRNYDIKRIPVVLLRQEGSTINLFRHGILMLIDIFKIKIYHIKGNYKN
jgi:dolichyl-phosphate beta-glucosyltransferase